MKSEPIIVYLPDQKDVEISPYGCGNFKLGFGVFTYSKLPGRKASCPGSSPICEAICYANRVQGPVREVWFKNTCTPDVPPIPAECKILRLHVGGDFDTVDYIRNWITRLTERPDVTAWAFTRSWRVAELLPILEELRALPNIQLFASLDPGMTELPPLGWRRAWTVKAGNTGLLPNIVDDRRLAAVSEQAMIAYTHDGKGDAPAYICPEETGKKKDCLSCGYCFEGKKHDVVFLEH
jgi:hypothetical protein